MGVPGHRGRDRRQPAHRPRRQPVPDLPDLGRPALAHAAAVPADVTDRVEGVLRELPGRPRVPLRRPPGRDRPVGRREPVSAGVAGLAVADPVLDRPVPRLPRLHQHLPRLPVPADHVQLRPPPHHPPPRQLFAARPDVTEPVRINWFYIGRGLRGEVLEADGQVELSVDLADLGEEFETAMQVPEHLAAGALADRPNAAAVPLGALYSADDGVVYQSDSIDWAVWAGGGDPAAATQVWMPLFDSDGTAVLDDTGVIPTLIPLT